MAQLEALVQQDPLDLLGELVQQDPQAQLVVPVQQDNKEELGPLDLLDPQDLREALVHKEILAPLALQVHRETLVTLA